MIRDGHADAELVDPDVRETGPDQPGERAEDDGADDPAPDRRHRDVLPGLLLARGPHPQRREEQQDHEEQDHREGRAQAAERDRRVRGRGRSTGQIEAIVLSLGEVADGVGLAEAQDQGADEGEGQAAQPAEHGRGVGVDDQQGQVEVLQDALAAGQEDPGQGGQRGAEGPGQHRRRGRAGCR